MTKLTITLDSFEKVNKAELTNELEHVNDMIQKGFIEGELIIGDRPVRGHWKINFEYYNTMTNKKIFERCTRCHTAIKPGSEVWLELSNTDGKYYEELPEGHVSQGVFPFGYYCYKRANEEL